MLERRPMSSRERGVSGAGLQRRGPPSPSSGPLISASRLRQRRAGASRCCPPHPCSAGVGRAQWRVELVRCRGGESAEFEVEARDTKGRLALSASYSQHWQFEKILRSKIKRAAPTSPVLSAVRPQPSNDDSRGQEPLQAGSRFASLPTGAELLLVVVVTQLPPIPSYSILRALIAASTMPCGPKQLYLS
jgi:hypothetical protein